MPHGKARSHANREPSTLDRQRHQEMVRWVFDWMRRTHGTQQLLVRCVQDFWRRRGDANYRCDHSLLSRILNPVSPHVPTAGRPKSMRILQAIMVVCTPCNDPNVIEQATDEDSAWSSDEEQAFKIHRARLRQLRENGRSLLFQSLHRMGEFAAVAQRMDDTPPAGDRSAAPDTLRRRACENVLLTLAALVDPGEQLCRLRDRLIAEAVAPEEARRLEEQQVRRIDAILAAVTPGVNMNAYGGAALFHCGQRERGMAMLLDAVTHSHDIQLRHDPHWETLLDLLETLLRHKDPAGEDWSLRAATIARDILATKVSVAAGGGSGGRQFLTRAWQMVHAPHVREHWLHAMPGLVERIESETTAASTDKPATGSAANTRNTKGASGDRSGDGTGGIKRMMMALAALLSLVLAAEVSAADADSQRLTHTSGQQRMTVQSEMAITELAIRGREALRPSPPPPPNDSQA